MYGSYKIIQLKETEKLYHSIRKTIDPNLKSYSALLGALESETTVYRHSFLIYEQHRNQGKGLKQHLQSLQKENLPNDTTFLFLFVKRDNLKALNMHMRSAGQVCGSWDGTEGYDHDYLIYYPV